MLAVIVLFLVAVGLSLWGIKRQCPISLSLALAAWAGLFWALY